jgi:sec-independent protein translocase protein TatB
VFDISFFELLVIAIVSLIVIGPERLPGAVKTGALWIGRIKRNLLEARQEIERQIGADDIRRELHNEQVMRNLEKMQDTRRELEEKIRHLEETNVLQPLSSALEYNTSSESNTGSENNVPTEPQQADVFSQPSDNVAPITEQASSTSSADTPKH